MGRALSRPLRVSGKLKSNFPQLYKNAHCRHIVFPAHGSTEWPRQGPPTHLTRETFSGRRPETGPIHSAESFVPAKTWPWGGGEDKVCGCRLNPSLISEVLPSLAARCISQSGSVLRRLYLRPQPHTTTIFPRDERLIKPPHYPVRWPYQRTG